MANDDSERSAFFKTRSLAILFKLRKLPRVELKAMCKVYNIKYIDLMCDMPIRWNSTDKMIKAMLRMERAIRTVLREQQWDESVRENLTLTDADWECLKEMAVFFDIFRRPTVQSQAEQYPTLHNVIPNYLHMIRQLNVWQLQDDKRVLKAAAKAAHVILIDYYQKSMSTRHSFVATICDPRYKLEYYEFLFEGQGGANSPQAKKAKAHFEHVFSDYKRRAVRIKEYERQQAENAVIEAREAREERSVTPEEVGQEDWRVNPVYGYSEYLARRPHRPVALANSFTGEVARWLGEECLPVNSTSEKVKEYMQSKAFDFPIITTMARDYLSIPATSAPSERAFSLAGNLISKKRGRIASVNVRYVLCLRSWGFLVDDDDEDEIIIDENGCIVEPVDGVVPVMVDLEAE